MIEYIRRQLEHGLPLTYYHQVILWEKATGERFEFKRRCTKCNGEGTCEECENNNYTLKFYNASAVSSIKHIDFTQNHYNIVSEVFEKPRGKVCFFYTEHRIPHICTIPVSKQPND